MVASEPIVWLSFGGMNKLLQLIELIIVVAESSFFELIVISSTVIVEGIVS